MIAALRDRDRGDDGMTMVELLITSAVLVTLLGMVLISMNLIQSIDTSVTSQYQEYDQVIPALAPIRSLIAAEVEPAPVSAGDVPTPAFQAIGNFSATWTNNIGTQFGNVVGADPACQPSCSAGPAQIVAEELDSSGNPVVSTPSPTGNSSCTAAVPCSFQVRMYLPQVVKGISSCPVLINGATATGAQCIYDLSGPYHLVANIQDVVNSPDSLDGSNDPTQPIFTYTLADPVTTTSVTVLTPDEVNQQSITGCGALTNCTGMGTLTMTTSSPSCPLDDVQSVAIHLLVNKTGSDKNGTNGEVENQIIDYRYPKSQVQTGISANTTCFPFQFSVTSLTPNLPSCNPYAS